MGDDPRTSPSGTKGRAGKVVRVDANAEREFQDALPEGQVRGRGAGLNPGNRFEDVRLHVLGDHLDDVLTENEDGTQVRTKVFRDRSRTLINPVDSADLHFKWTINPYRGCEHGCIYCYARPTHEYAGLSSGLDFETKILAKHDAPELLRRELASPTWHGEPIMISGVTDPYQPVERELKITRRVLELVAECRQPISLITKNRLITRDLDLLHELHAHRAVHAAISVTTLDHGLASTMEPRASSPKARIDAIRQLSKVGVPVAVMVAPVIPGLNDHEIPRILEAAREAGAVAAGCILLRLPYQIKALFLDWLVRHVPDRADKVESLIRQTRDGELYDSRMFVRQRGEGEIAGNIRRTFDVFAKRYGLGERWSPLNTKAFRRPNVLERGQMGLFVTKDTLFG